MSDCYDEYYDYNTNRSHSVRKELLNLCKNENKGILHKYDYRNCYNYEIKTRKCNDVERCYNKYNNAYFDEETKKYTLDYNNYIKTCIDKLDNDTVDHYTPISHTCDNEFLANGGTYSDAYDKSDAFMNFITSCYNSKRESEGFRKSLLEFDCNINMLVIFLTNFQKYAKK